MSIDIHFLINSSGEANDVFHSLSEIWSSVEGVRFSLNPSLEGNNRFDAVIRDADMEIEGLRQITFVNLNQQLQNHYRNDYGKNGVDVNWRVSALMNKSTSAKTQPSFDHARVFECVNCLINWNRKRDVAVIYSGLTFMHYQNSLLRIHDEWLSLVPDCKGMFDVALARVEDCQDNNTMNTKPPLGR